MGGPITVATARLGPRGRRTARLVLAAALVVAAPVVGGTGRGDATTTSVPTLARDLPAGHLLSADDLTTTALPETALPDGALTSVDDLLGDRLARAVRRGELLTDAGLAGSGDARPAGPRRVVPVPLVDPAVAELLSAGDLVDLVAPTADPADPGGAPPVVRGARVREVPAGRPGGHRSVLVEVPEGDAVRLAATAAGTPLAVLVHG